MISLAQSRAVGSDGRACKDLPHVPASALVGLVHRVHRRAVRIESQGAEPGVEALLAQPEVTGLHRALHQADSAVPHVMEVAEQEKDRVLVVHVDEVEIEEFVVGVDEGQGLRRRAKASTSSRVSSVPRIMKPSAEFASAASRTRSMGRA